MQKNNGCDIIKVKRANLNRKTKWDDVFDVYYELIGTENDRSLVTEMFLATVVIVRNLSKKRYEESKKSESFRYWNSSYITGFMTGLSIKLRTNQEQIKIEDETGKFGLIQVKKNDLIQEYIKKNKGPLKLSGGKGTNFSRDAFSSGMEDGKDNRNKKIC